MNESVRVAVARINLTVGDLDGNVDKALERLQWAEAADADVVLFPELTIVGYPPEDLALKPGVVADNRRALERFAAATTSTAAVIGFLDGEGHGDTFNAAAVCAQGEVAGVYHKRDLPNYDVFDEKRTLRPGSESMRLYSIAGVEIGVSICADVWVPDGPVNELARGGARIVVNINGSPFRKGKQQVREQVVADRVSEDGVPIVYANLVGGQDELVFDGGSFVMSPGPSGPVITGRSPRFVESFDVFDVEPAARRDTLDQYPVVEVSPAPVGQRQPVAPVVAPEMDPRREVWEALVVGVRDYVTKSGFTDVCLGLSGGVDSSITAAIAVDALGPEHVAGVLMPSRYSSDHSISDAEALAANLGIRTFTVPIEPAHAAFGPMLTPHLDDQAIEVGDLTDQNLQSRLRGVILMALANEHRWLVLTTGNKSEAAVGYSTLYGDTAGAYAVIKDVWKLSIYELCNWRNRQGDAPVIPDNVLTKAPSAELKPDQRDDQSLPPYEVLDPILRAYVEHDLNVAEICALGIAGATNEMVRDVCRLVDLAEFKRRQTPLGTRVSSKAFGRDRRIPIINRYRG